MQLLKRLRETTNAPMMECKAALSAVPQGTKDDEAISQAVDWLRKKGIATAEKRSGRVTPQGVIALKVDRRANVGVLVELNSETDFVSRNNDFYLLASKAATLALQIADSHPLDENINVKLLTNGEVGEMLAKLVLATRENIKISRAAQLRLMSGNGVMYPYMHRSIEWECPQQAEHQPLYLGHLGVLLGLNSSHLFSAEQLHEIEHVGKQIALHLVAMTPPPLYLKKEQVPKELINKERNVILEQINTNTKKKTRRKVFR